MLTAFTIDGVPEHIYFCKAENYDHVLMGRDIGKEFVMSQEISLETLVRLSDSEFKVFCLCLIKPK